MRLVLPAWRPAKSGRSTPAPAVTETSPFSRFRTRDLYAEAIAGIGARPARTGLTILGTVLGIATLVTTLGVSSTAGNQIAGRFDAVTATEIRAVITTPEPGQLPYVPWTAVDNLTHLNGIRNIAALSLSDAGRAPLVRANTLHDPTRTIDTSLTIAGTTASLATTIGAAIDQGRFFDQGHIQRREPVAVLGQEAAQALAITQVDTAPAVFVGDESFTVIGILGPIERSDSAALNGAVLLPWTTADDRLQLGSASQVLIQTVLGASSLIAEQAPLALSPNDPGQVSIDAPPDPASLRTGVADDLNSLLLILSLVSLVVGALGIANVTLVTVMERVGEIGLRRALGARRRHIATQFLAESTVVGLLGGILGASLGIVVVVGISIARDWTPVLDYRPVLAAAPCGALVGLLAGLYPAARAASMQPVDALRSPT
jgi:putative ABC transport system permease protein